MKRNNDRYTDIPSWEIEEEQRAEEMLVIEALSVMTPTQREVWTLIINKRCSVREAACTLKKHPSTVWKIYHAGLHRVAEIMGGIGGMFLDYPYPSQRKES